MKRLIILMICCVSSVYSQEVRKRGASPGPLFGFGQNIVDPGRFITSGYVEKRGGKKLSEVEFDLGMIYGITERVSLFTELMVLSSKVNGIRSSGLGSVLLQGEYALYWHRQENDFDNLWTLITGFLFPTFNKGDGVLGTNCPGLFLGTTTSHNSTRWYAYASFGEITFFKRNTLKPGWGLLYEFGLGFPLSGTSTPFYLSLIFEFNGSHFSKDVINHFAFPDSGGTGMFFGPVLYFFYKNITIEAGIQRFFIDNLFGQQPHNKYRAALYISYAT